MSGIPPKMERTMLNTMATANQSRPRTVDCMAQKRTNLFRFSRTRKMMPPMKLRKHAMAAATFWVSPPATFSVLLSAGAGDGVGDGAEPAAKSEGEIGGGVESFGSDIGIADFGMRNADVDICVRISVLCA